jgi:DNA primase
MKRTFLFIFIGLTFISNTFAQNMRELVRTMPDSILTLLTRNDRLDFIDYLDSNMKAEVTNKTPRSEKNGIVELTIHAYNQHGDLVLTNITEAIVKCRP